MLSVNISRQTDQNKLDWIKKKLLKQTAIKVQSKVVFLLFLSICELCEIVPHIQGEY